MKDNNVALLAAFLKNSFLERSSRVLFSKDIKSWLMLVKVFFGGQTITFGNLTSSMWKVSSVVETGCSAQLSYDWLMRIPAPVMPPSTTQTQSSLSCLAVLEI